MKILYILRGVPGSGKSTLAHQLTKYVYEADQYFLTKEGEYKWHPKKIPAAHKDCERRVFEAMKAGLTPIAVANTFIERKFMAPYIRAAKRYGYQPGVIVCRGNYRNIHNVPDEVVVEMKKRFEE